MSRFSLPLKPWRPLVVGSLGASAELALLAQAGLRDQCDVVEVRLDTLDGDLPALRKKWQKCELPLLFTARRPEEGGQGGYAAAARETMLHTVLEDADFIDVEVSAAGELGDLISIAQLRGIGVVLSSHDFEKTPATPVLRDTIQRARDLGASVAKIATRVDSAHDLARLADLLGEDFGLPLSLMGMGPMAAASRLWLAQLGSVLNYGFLGATPTAPGQWSAGRLKEALAALPVLPQPR